MRGDWIHDLVQVEMDYRAGSKPMPRHSSAEKRRSRPRRSLWSALFTRRQLHLPR
jgi:hypothetical protein